MLASIVAACPARYHLAAVRWLIHGNISEPARVALTRHGQQVHVPVEFDLAADAPPSQVLKLALARQLEIMTTDATLAQAPFEPGNHFPRTMVLLKVAEEPEAQEDAIERLFTRYKRLSGSRLYTVTDSRVKIRQLP